MSERARVLVVDDSPLMRRFLERFLGDGFDVETVADGALAVDLLASGKTYEVLLVDLAMPLVDGRELYETVGARFPALQGRIVFITGGAVTSEDDKFLRSVPNTVVHKPFDNDELREIVRRTAALGLTT
jgi:CheY-like chemotaxis protein